MSEDPSLLTGSILISIASFGKNISSRSSYFHYRLCSSIIADTSSFSFRFPLSVIGREERLKGIHLSRKILIEAPFPTLHRIPCCKTALASYILRQVSDELCPSETSISEPLGKYLALKTPKARVSK